MKEFFKKYLGGIKSYLSKFQTKAPYFRDGIRPAADWNRILFIFGFIFILSAISAFYIYRFVNSENFYNHPDGETDSVQISKKLLDQVVADSKYHNEILNTLSAGTKNILGDPSF